MNQLCKHICWKVFGFIADRYYVDNMATFLRGFWCCFKLANLIITGGLLEKKRALLCISATGNVFIKIRLQICNQLSGSPDIIRG